MLTTAPFDELQRLAQDAGVDKSLDFLEHHFRRDQEYFKLFEVLKMRCRRRLGLPLIYAQQPDELNESQQRELEDGLLDACREIGTLFFKAGKFQEGWMYLQPVGDKSLNEKLIQAIKPDEENIDSLIEISVSQGAAPGYGFGLLLTHYGTCNGITTFDTQASRFDPEIQRQMASRLLQHIYAELLGNVRYAIGQNTDTDRGISIDDASLAEILVAYPELTAGGAHHIDTTHLASLMRIARVVTDPKDIRMASELADYGKGLAEDFQYPGSPPFENTYVDHQFFFRGLLGEGVDAAIAHFESKLNPSEVEQFGPVAEEVLVDYLVRVGRPAQAIAILTEHLLGKHEPLGIAPHAFEIAKTPADHQRLMDFYQSQNDLLGYAVSLLQREHGDA